MIMLDGQNNRRLITTREAADFLSVSCAYLAKDRWLAKKSSKAPVVPFVHIGGAVRYSMSDLLEFISNNKVGDPAA